jgi:hypothetical protein
VEGGHPHRPHRAPDQLPDPLAHLRRGLVGEGDREDLTRPGGTGGEQIGDPVGQDPGLARAGPRHHQHRPLDVFGGRPLRRIEPGQQPLDAVGAGLGGSPAKRVFRFGRDLKLALQHRLRA